MAYSGGGGRIPPPSLASSSVIADLLSLARPARPNRAAPTVSAEPLLQVHGHLRVGVVLAELRAQRLLQRQPVRPLARGHQRGRERKPVDGAADLDRPTG